MICSGGGCGRTFWQRSSELPCNPGVLDDLGFTDHANGAFGRASVYLAGRYVVTQKKPGSDGNCRASTRIGQMREYQIPCAQSRPDFKNPQQWLHNFQQCRSAGCKQWPPATRDELLLAESTGLLASHPQWLPAPQNLRLLGLPDWFGRQAQPLPMIWRRRVYQTLADDPELCVAVVDLLRRATA